MEKETLPSGFRARAAQLLTWLMGPVQQQRQQQTMQADRQMFDGVTRGMDDPDNRRQQQMPRQQPEGRAREEESRQAWRETQEVWQDAQRARGMSGRALGYDGPDDARIPREIGPASGSGEAALMQARCEAHRARQAQEDSMQGPARERLAAQIEAVQQRLQAQQHRSRGQGRGW